MREDLEKTARDARWAYQDALAESSRAYNRYVRCKDRERGLEERARETEAAAVASYETKGDTK